MVCDGDRGRMPVCAGHAQRKITQGSSHDRNAPLGHGDGLARLSLSPRLLEYTERIPIGYERLTSGGVAKMSGRQVRLR